MKPLVVIPARGGSKGLPRKNSKLLNGKPLIHYTIDAAREVFPDNRILVSTDDEEIRECAEKAGIKVPFLRPAHLATDTSSSREVMLHALEAYTKRGEEIDTVVLLQPTSPLRTAAHIKSAIEIYTPDIDMVVSVKETDANPYYVLKEEDEFGFLQPSKKGTFTRRQDCPKVYELNGAVYVINKESLVKREPVQFEKVKKVLMDKESSVDIDDLLDFQLAGLILENRK